MKKTVFIVMLSTILCAQISAQKLTHPQQQKVDQLYKNNTVAYFKFPVQSRQDAAQLAKIISVDNVKGNMVFAHANKQQFTAFIVKNYNYTVIPSPQKKKPAAPAKKTTTATSKKTTSTTKQPTKK